MPAKGRSPLSDIAGIAFCLLKGEANFGHRQFVARIANLLTITEAGAIMKRKRKDKSKPKREAKPKPNKRVIEQVEAFVAQARQSPSEEVRKRGEFIAAQIQPYKLGLLPAADLLAALQKQAAIPPTQQGDRTPDLHETEFVLEVLKLAAKVAPLLLL